MKPRVLLIGLPYVVKNVDVNRPKIRSFSAFPYGLLSMVTYNKAYADITVVDWEVYPDYETYEESLSYFSSFDVVGFSMLFDNSYKSLKAFLRTTKEKLPNTIIILGGAAASYSCREILNDCPELDAICYSEGEIAFKNLLLNLHQAKIFLDTSPNWATHASKDKELQVAYVSNLDEVIDLDYSLVDIEAYDMQQAFSPYVDYSKSHKQFFLVTSRGCPYSCAFCSNSTIHGKSVRLTSVDKTIEHVKHLVDDLRMDVLTIYDDQLLLYADRAKELFRRLIPFNLRIEMPNGVSVRFMDKEMAYLMRIAGVDTVYLAIESGSKYVLKELINKPLKLEEVAPAVQACREAGIFTHGFFVLGMPGETREHREETRKFIKEVGLDWAGINLATPVRGSRLYEDCIKNGWIKKQKIEDIVDKKYIIEYPGVDPKEVEEHAYEINLDVNFHSNRDMLIGNYERAASCFKEVLKRYSEHKWAKHYLSICEKKLEGKNNG